MESRSPLQTLAHPSTSQTQERKKILGGFSAESINESRATSQVTITGSKSLFTHSSLTLDFFSNVFDENVIIDAPPPMGRLSACCISSFCLCSWFAPMGPKFSEPPFSSRLSLDSYSVGGFVPCFVSL